MSRLSALLDSSSESEDELACSQSAVSSLDETENDIISNLSHDDGRMPTPSHVVKPGKTSTPQQINRTVDNLNKHLDIMIQSHKTSLRKIRQRMQADNQEFLATLEAELSGERVVNDNENLGQVIHNGKDLMSLVAGNNPYRFGRELAKVVFGEGNDCLLIDFMIGQEKSSPFSRPRVDPQLENIFCKVVRMNYPRDPELCLREARSAANQFGLDCRRRKRSIANMPSGRDERVDE